jgi:hypothetical protein
MKPRVFFLFSFSSLFFKPILHHTDHENRKLISFSPKTSVCDLNICFQCLYIYIYIYKIFLTQATTSIPLSSRETSRMYLSSKRERERERESSMHIMKHLVQSICLFSMHFMICEVRSNDRRNKNPTSQN